MKAFLTGSYAYGIPRKDSDIDLVIRADEDVALWLAVVALAEHTGSGGTLRFGRLNLIVATTDEEYETWRQGTIDLIAHAPVSREVAVQHFAALMKKAQGVT